MAGIVRLDNVRSVYNGHIFSVVYNSGTLENGMVGVVGALVTGERELRNLATPSGITQKNLVLIAHPEIVYSQFRLTDNALENFSIPAGQPARAYQLEIHDIFSISIDKITTLGGAGVAPVANNYIIAQAGLTLKEEATLGGTEGFIGQVLSIETWGTTTFVGQAGAIQRQNQLAVIEVLQN